jgi:hypothetical protein
MNSIVSALRFFFTYTIDRPDLARKAIRVPHPRNLPVVLSRDEVARLLNATTSLKHQAALSVAYGAGLRVGASGFGGDIAPVAKRAENRREGPPPRRQTILHPRRYLVVNDSMDDAIRF